MEKANIDKVLLWLFVIVLATAFIGLPFVFGHVEGGSLLNLLIAWWMTLGVMWLFATKWRQILALVNDTWQHQRHAKRAGSWYISLKLLLMLGVFAAIVLAIYLYGDTYLRIALHSPDSEAIAAGALAVLLFSCGKIIGYHRSEHDHETDMEQSIGLTV
ncbi:MAG: hypothetical protein ACREGB_03460 [Candidatus Saccharimonadales bacterium]